jgi:hypothetical protein
MVTSFSGGGSRSTRREPSTMGKQLVKGIYVPGHSTHRTESTLTVYQRNEWYVVILTNQLKYITVNDVLGEGMDLQAKEWSFLFRNGLIEHIGCKAGTMALSFIQCSHSHKILMFLSYYIHCYVFQLVCQYDDIPLVSLIYCKRTFFPMCRMSWNVNTLAVP